MEKALRLLLVGLGASPLFVVGCGGGTPPTMQGRTGMMSQTAIAAKCTEAAKGHERPFVVEWDATDLASFEAKAASNTMFVHYEGCKLDILYECKDPNVSAKFGNYGQPQFTSGTVQGFDIANEGELYAKLPLGAGALSGRVSAGETLHLKYFVSGVAMSTRDSLYKGEIEPLPGCATATHFVSSYNLGAFELESTAKSAGEANAGIGNIGAGGSRSHNEASVGRGGDLVSCTTQDQRACRVPIRLVLKAITPGSHPAGNLTAGGPPPGGGAPGTAPALPAGLQEQIAVGEEVSQAINKANELAGEGDGVGCLAKLDRALALDARRADHTRQTYARCLMMAGKCDEGQKMYREVRAAEDTKRLLSDETLDKEAHDRANNMCPSSTAKSAADFVMRAARDGQGGEREGPRGVQAEVRGHRREAGAGRQGGQGGLQEQGVPHEREQHGQERAPERRALHRRGEQELRRGPQVLQTVLPARPPEHEGHRQDRDRVLGDASEAGAGQVPVTA